MGAFGRLVALEAVMVYLLAFKATASLLEIVLLNAPLATGVVLAESTPSQHVLTCLASIVPVHSERHLATAAFADRFAQQALRDNAAGITVTLFIHIVTLLAESALILCIALDALGDEVGAGLALP